MKIIGLLVLGVIGYVVLHRRLNRILKTAAALWFPETVRRVVELSRSAAA